MYCWLFFCSEIRANFFPKKKRWLAFYIESVLIFVFCFVVATAIHILLSSHANRPCCITAKQCFKHCLILVRNGKQQKIQCGSPIQNNIEIQRKFFPPVKPKLEFQRKMCTKCVNNLYILSFAHVHLFCARTPTHKHRLIWNNNKNNSDTYAHLSIYREMRLHALCMCDMRTLVCANA